MIELVSVPALLSGPRYSGAAWLSTRLHWTRAEEVALKALCEYEAPLEKSADSLGRSPTSIAHRALDTGLVVPPEWREIVRPKRKSLPKPPRVELRYPYIRQIRGEHADLLAVNTLVPRGLPDYERADVCQEIMLALWMKETSLEELRSDRALLGRFVRGFRKANFEAGGQAISLDVPMRDGRSWYDVLPDPATVDEPH